MPSCPYTWFRRNIIKTDSPSESATALRVSVIKNSELVVDVSLPAQSARWLISLIPEETVQKIKAEGIPLMAIQEELALQEKLIPSPIFEFNEENRKIKIWLE